MKPKTTPLPEVRALRHRAELKLRGRPSPPEEVQRETDPRALLHELQVRQIELELQNEELLRAQAEAQRAADQYTALFENMLNGIAYCRLVNDQAGPLDFTYLAVNQAFETLTGLKDVVGKKASGVIPGIRKSDPELLETYARVVRTGVPERFEEYVQALQMWFSISVYRSGPEHFTAVFDVITERKQAEEALRESERLYHSLVEQLPQAIFRLDRAGRITFANRRYCEQMGRELKDLVGQSDFSLFPADLATQYWADTRSVLETGQVFDTIERHVNPEGRESYVHVMKSPLRDGAGQMIGVQVLFSDVSDRKRAEDALQETAARVQHLNEVLRAVRDVNRLLSREEDPVKLLTGVCTLLVQTRDYVKVWVGQPASDSKRVVPIAWSGTDPAFLQHTPITWDDSPLGQGPTGLALRERRPVIFDDLAHDPRFAPWRDADLAYGAASIASIPLLCRERLFGVLTVKADRPRAFDGEEMDLLTTLAADVARALQHLEDQAAQREAEVKLSASEEQFRAMFEMASIGIAQADPHTGQWLRVNPKMCAITGCSADELLEMRIADITHPEDRLHDLELFQRVAHGETADYRLEKRYVRKDASLAWVNVNMTLLRNAAGQPTRTMATIEDITARKRAEQALREANDFNQQVIASAREGIIVHDRQGRPLVWNRFMEELTGCPAAEASRGLPLELFPFLRHYDFDRLFQHALAGQVLDSPDMFHEDARTGRKMWTVARLGPLRDERGTVNGVIVMVDDITERKNLERQLLAISEREQERIGQDLHDGLSQQLTGIILLASSLQEALRARGVPEADDAHRIEELLLQTQQNLRLTARGLHPVADVPEGLSIALTELATSVSERGDITCRFRCGDQVLISDNRTATHLFRITQEAVHNAIRHGHPKNISVSLTQEKGMLVLQVQDNGRGLGTAQGKNAGMGLRIMQSRSQAMNGKITVHPTQPHGTLVRCTLPLPVPTRKPHRR